MTLVVIDASIAMRWFIDDPFSTDAEGFRRERGNECIAPELIVYEIVNAAWKSVRSGGINGDQYARIVRELPMYFDRLADGTALADHAAELAVRFNHSAYDCFYVALAAREGCALATADRGMAALARRAAVKVELIGGRR